MSAQRVTKLRKEGKLSEALELAKNNIAADADNIWNIRALAWVYCELLKSAQENQYREEFMAMLNNISSLQLPDNELMLFEYCAWQIGKHLYARNEFENKYLNEVFQTLRNFHFPKPSDSYSFLMRSFHKHSQYWSGFLDFVDWWNLDNFQQKDYEKYITEDNKKIPSLVESVYIAVSKKLLKESNIERVENFLPSIADICHNHKEMQYPPYYYAKLLLQLGDHNNFLLAFLPFARKKQKDFWVWGLLADNYPDDSDDHFACLCKAMLCGAPDKFTITIREKIAKYLIVTKEYASAKFELKKILLIRNMEGWHITDKHKKWENLPWWDKTHENRNNKDIYCKNDLLAQKLLFDDKPAELLVVDNVNTDKKVFRFIVSENVNGFINYSNFDISPIPGNVYETRFKERNNKEKSNFYQIFTIVETDKPASEKVLKIVCGKVKIKSGNTFGFLQNAFVPPAIIQKCNLKNNNEISAKAILKYNAKHKEWGWSVVEILELINKQS